MTLRARTLTTFRTDDEASNRFQEHVKEVVNPVLKSLAASLTWIRVGDPGAPSFGSGWASFGGGFNMVGFAKDALGIVHLRGLASCAAGCADGTAIFQLPAGYRPLAIERHVSVGEGGAPAAMYFIDVHPEGGVLIRGTVAAGGFRSLDGITFEAVP